MSTQTHIPSEDVSSPQSEAETPTKLPSLDMFGKVSAWFGTKNVDQASPVFEEAKSKVSSWFGTTDSTGADEAISPVLEGAKTKLSSWFGSKDALAEDPTSPVMEGAKTIGSMLYSAVNKAGQTVTEAGAKIKKSVEENTILGEFNKEQESFIQEKVNNQTKALAALPPWVGHSNEEKLKAACIDLSKDKKNFTRDPPPGVDFEFDYTTQYPVAMVTLENDKQLELMRFELVPAVLNEATFWRNYFYRVSLISQANELSSLEADHMSAAQPESPSAEAAPSAHDSTAPPAASRVLDSPADSQDFVSDSLDASHQDLDEIREEMRKLGLSGCDGGVSTTEEEWEKELEAEMNEFELVAPVEAGADSADSPWDTQIESALDTIE